MLGNNGGKNATAYIEPGGQAHESGLCSGNQIIENPVRDGFMKSALVAAGVSSKRLDSISYGEEIPLDPAHDDAAYAKNRRVHFSIGQNVALGETNAKY